MESGGANVLEVSGLVKNYSYGKYQIPALSGVGFTLREGEFAGLFGPNGAGKTTAIKAIVGLVRPDAGEVLVGGASIRTSPGDVKRQIGYVSQDRAVMSSVSVAEELVFQARSFGLAKPVARRAAAAVAGQLGISDLLGRQAISLSGGQRRRVEIGMALVHQPRLLVLDEPTLGLDPDTREGLWQIIEQVRGETGTAILMSTHYLDEASSLMSRVIVLDHGRVVESGAPGDIIARHARGVVELGEFTVPQDVASVLAGQDWPGSEIETSGGRVLIRSAEPGRVAAAAVSVLAGRGVHVGSVSTRPATISDAFYAITGRPLDAA